MTNRHPLLIPAILCVLVIAAFIGLKSYRSGTAPKDTNGAEQGNTPASVRESDPLKPSQTTKRERQGEAEAKALRDLEKEFDQILPAQFPEQFSALSDSNLKTGESLVLGGFKRSDGNYEFTRLKVDPVTAEDGSIQYRISTRSLSINSENSSKVGLDSLISPARTRIQKSLKFPSNDITMLKSAVDTMTSPIIQVKPGTAATISIGTAEQAYVISVMVSPTDDGESMRVRTRVESPAGE